MKLRIATAQFPVGPDIAANAKMMIRQMREASGKGADVIHFPESALTGYPGIDMPSFDNFNWPQLKQSSKDIAEHARELSIWVIFGSAHPLTPPHKPHNCLYIINNKGELMDRYDKRFCASNEEPISGELSHFGSGDYFAVFEIGGVKCSCLICHDYRYPELYRQLKLKGVEVVFHSFYAGNMDPGRKEEMESEVGHVYHPINRGNTLPEITMPATMISYAANNYLWISCSNTSAKESCWPAMFVRPDGVIIGKLGKHQEGILLTEIDTSSQFYDSTRYWRKRAIEGVFYSGERVEDPRSSDRSNF